MESALEKVKMSESLWNSRKPQMLEMACSTDTEWTDRTQVINGTAEVQEFLRGKFERQLNYSQQKTLWGFRGNRMAVRTEQEWQDASGQWFRSTGNELMEYDKDGLISKRHASDNELAITSEERILK
ncbi:nuclear transport factor 2 family protein [Pedobacter ginsengiterrae]|uniref:Nuclear transport factor 2 family protein n=2 Tax=Pedobacter ginsengiterrae TaxID=871696 RepID=A0ABP7PIN6_9SPHI